MGKTCYDRDDGEAYQFERWDGTNTEDVLKLFSGENEAGVVEVQATIISDKAMALDVFTHTGYDGSRYLLQGDYVVNVGGIPVIMGPRGFDAGFVLNVERLDMPKEHDKLVSHMRHSRDFSEIYEFLRRQDSEPSNNSAYENAPKEKSWHERKPKAAMFDIDYFLINKDFDPGDLLTLQDLLFDAGQEVFAVYSGYLFYDAPGDPSKPYVTLDRVEICPAHNEAPQEVFIAPAGNWIVIQNGVAIRVIDDGEMGEIFGTSEE
jgi:hypothetical protein